MADRYWVGGSGTWDTTTTTNWSTSSGGSGGASVPTASDSVFFDQAGTYTITMTGALTCLDITTSAGSPTFVTGTTPTLAISGSMSLVAGTIWSSSGTITFNATTAGKTITTNGVQISAGITLNGVGGAWSLVGALTLTGTLTITNGSFDAVTYNVTAGSVISNVTNIRTIALGSGTWTITSTTWNVSPTQLTISGSGIISLTSSSAKGFSGGTLSIPNVTLNQGGAGTLTLYNSFTFKNITNTYAATGATAISFSSGYTTTVSQFTASGTAGNLLTLSGGGTLALTGGGTVSVDYITVSGVIFTPGPATDGSTPYVWYLGANSSKSSSGQTSTGGLLQAAGSVKVYQITNTATTSWTVPADWNSASNTIHMIGAGGGGASSVYLNIGQAAAGAGGGGGGYTSTSNYSAAPSSSITVAVGIGGATDTDGGNTSWASGAYVAGGGKKGVSATTPSSTGGAGGTGTYTGGSGGDGSFYISGGSGGIYLGSGAGGGAAGPNGNGGNGGKGYNGSTNALMAGGGGGGNGGGTSGGDATSTAGGTGGNNSSGTGGGAGSTGSTVGAAGTLGGGGGGGRGFGSGGIGGYGVDILNTIGGAGGKGGNAQSNGVSVGGYGSGGCGGRLAYSTPGAGSAGGQGLIVIAYTPVTTASPGKMFLMF